jgi:hypothetical protein
MAVEMEGSGVADATWDLSAGYFIIRGICDYCDANKTDIWQDYAAIVAAGYTRALLESLPETTLRKDESTPFLDQPLPLGESTPPASRSQRFRTYPNRKCKNGVFQNVCTENACHSEDQEMSSSQDV